MSVLLLKENPMVVRLVVDPKAHSVILEPTHVISSILGAIVDNQTA